MARPETWQQLRYFKPDSGIDRWGDPGMIADNLLLKLDDFRHWLGVPVIVLSGVKVEGHSRRSFHYESNGACAVDVVIPHYHNAAYDLILDATRFGFTGIGWYPHWRYNDETCGGLHLDTRPLRWDDDMTKNYSHARWMGVRGEDGKQHYIEMNYENILKYEREDVFLN